MEGAGGGAPSGQWERADRDKLLENSSRSAGARLRNLEPRCGGALEFEGLECKEPMQGHDEGRGVRVGT